MVTMLGLTWLFGYFLLVPSNQYYEEAMQWLFTIFNAFQVKYTNSKSTYREKELYVFILQEAVSLSMFVSTSVS